jgi:hypothetical protein
MNLKNKLYKLIGSPGRSIVIPKWYNYIIPKRITVKSNPPIYKWLWWNFAWLKNNE